MATSFRIESTVRGHHVYKASWSPYIGEELPVQCQVNNIHNDFAVAAVASEAYHDWSGEAAGARLRVNFTLKLLLSQNFCNRPLMRFIRFASIIGPAAAVPAGPAPAPLSCPQEQQHCRSCTMGNFQSLLVLPAQEWQRDDLYRQW